ncbi:invasion associated secreted endopeptidase [Flavobacteriaceae bacterium]
MKFLKGFVLVFIFCSVSVFSQEKNIKHTIVKGETISSIAEKYNVSVGAIYKLNPKAKKTLQLNQVLSIPFSESNKTKDNVEVVSKTTELNHEVLPKETLYGITKQFKTTAELLYKANPQLESEGLKIGQSIIIPTTLSKKEVASLSIAKKTETPDSDEPLQHKVKPNESLYAIAKEYGVTLKELQKANPKIGKKGLSIGQEITIPSNGKVVANEVVSEENRSEPNAILVENKVTVPVVAEIATKRTEIITKTQIQTSEIIHEVLPKETKYGIAKKYGITVSVLEKQNPAIQQKLLVGSKLSIQVPNDTIVTPAKNEVVLAKDSISSTVSSAINIANEDLVNQLIESASGHIGTRYRSGGTTAAGFDCSGFMCSTFGGFDIKLPRSSIEQAQFGEKVNAENIQKGDLIFFKTNGRRHINHVGMVVDVVDGEIKFIHSSTHGGVIISSTKEPYYNRNFAQVNRVIH